MIHQTLNKARIRKDEEITRAVGLTKHQGTRLDTQMSGENLCHLTCRGQWLHPSYSHDHGIHEVFLCPGHTIILVDNALKRLRRRGKGIRSHHRRN